MKKNIQQAGQTEFQARVNVNSKLRAIEVQYVVRESRYTQDENPMNTAGDESDGKF